METGDTREDQSTTEQRDEERRTRQTGGDAPAAASIEEREAVAEDTDELFEGEDSTDTGDDD